MQISSRLLLRTAIIVLGLLLAMSVYVAVNSQSAKALDATQWETVRQYVNDYFSSEAPGGDETGLIYPKAKLMHNLGGDTGTDAVDTVLASYLGEGDDMSSRPVIIDNLMVQTTDIPGTEFRCNWNTAGSCFGQSSIDAVKSLVDAHAAAGFSTDIVDYCVTSHTATPTTAGFGVIAQTGALQSGGGVPKVYELWYSRCGWNNTCINPTDGHQPVGYPDVSFGGFGPIFPTSPGYCSGSDAEVVRCTADWAISLTGGNTGNGVTDIPTIAAAGQSIDVRPGNILTMSTPAPNLQLPLDVLFSTGYLAQIDPTKTFVVASKTQHGGQAAMGLTMLGYQGIHYAVSTANGGFINGGIYRWSSLAYGSPNPPFAPLGDILPLLSVSFLTAGPGVKVDTSGVVCPGSCTAPVITSVSTTATGYSTGTISRTVNKPATTRVDLVGSDGSTATVKDTILHANDSVSLAGLNPGVTYTGTLTVYDSNAVSSSTPIGFTTAIPDYPCPPDLQLGLPIAHWGSYADYTAHILTVDWRIDNAGVCDAYTVEITGGTNTHGVTFAQSLPTSGISITAGSSAVIPLRYDVPVSTGSWLACLTASARDFLGITYTYPA